LPSPSEAPSEDAEDDDAAVADRLPLFPEPRRRLPRWLPLREDLVLPCGTASAVASLRKRESRSLSLSVCDPVVPELPLLSWRLFEEGTARSPADLLLPPFAADADAIWL